MGYAQTVISTAMTNFVLSTKTSTVTLPVGAANQTIGTIVVPTLTGSVVGAYARLITSEVKNAFAGQNYVDGAQVIQVDNTAAGGYVDAIDIYDTCGNSANGASPKAIGVIIGNDDIAAKVTSGTTLTFRWTSAKAAGASLIFYCAVEVTLIMVGA